MSEQIKREFTLSFPMAKIKRAIEDTCSSSGGIFQVKDRNTVFNSYSLVFVKSLNVLPVTVTLKQHSESETIFELSAIPGPSFSRMPNVVTTAIEDFLKKVGEFASGRLVIRAPTPQENANNRANGNRNTFILGVVVLLLAIVAYFVYKQK